MELRILGFNGEIPVKKSDIESIREFLKSNILNSAILLEINKNLNNLLSIFHHKELAKRQRNAYESMRKNLPEDYLFIEVDYKQKVIFYQ